MMIIIVFTKICTHVNVTRGTLLAALLGYYNGSVFVLKNLAVNRVLTCVRDFIILEIIMLLTCMNTETVVGHLPQI